MTVLERICDGLGVPREFMRLSGRVDGVYPGGVTVTASPEEVNKILRRVLLATGIAVVGQPVPRLGELLALPGPSPVPLPSRVDGIHVAQVRNLTRRLGDASNTDTDPEVLSAAAAWATRLLGVSGAGCVGC